jgi:hypothetical protein
MSVANKLLRAAAGNASKAVYVDDVFSTFLYQGTGSSLAINNGVDLDGEGGLIWSKRRDSTARTHILVDSVRGATKVLNSDGAYAEYTMSNMPSSFNSNGYTIGTSDAGVNNSGDSYVSWTFRKAKKFFDIVTYTGNGTAGHAVSHNLGSVPGMILIKNLTGESWLVYHRGIGNTKSLTLNTTAAEDTSIAYFNNTDPTSTHFTLGTVGSGGVNNENGVSYIAYLFAHNDGDGEYGEDGDQDIIKCGSYTGTGSYSSPPVINLGFEPQWVMIKNATSTGDWLIGDVMRGATSQIIGSAGEGKILKANSSDAEVSYSGGYIPISPTATGFTMSIDGSEGNASGKTYIYVAIRRPNKPASEFAATDLYKSLIYTGDGSSSKALDFGFSPDLMIGRSRAFSGTLFINRIAGVTKQLTSHNSNAENTNSDYVASFDQLGITVKSNFIGSANQLQHGFRRVKNFFDVVTYTGTDSTNNINHNLGVAPEMIIIKNRSDARDWSVYHKDVYGSGGVDYVLTLNSNAAQEDLGIFNSPTATQFTVKTSFATVNASGDKYIAYLFATTNGISKVGSYTGTGSDLNVDCGFSAGARFVSIKRTDSTGDWYVYDSVRGIVAGNDPYVFLNNTDTEVTNTDYIDPLSSGFTVTSSAPAGLNASSGTYIFLAIA